MNSDDEVKHFLITEGTVVHKCVLSYFDNYLQSNNCFHKADTTRSFTLEEGFAPLLPKSSFLYINVGESITFS